MNPQGDVNWKYGKRTNLSIKQREMEKEIKMKRQRTEELNRRRSIQTEIANLEIEHKQLVEVINYNKDLLDAMNDLEILTTSKIAETISNTENYIRNMNNQINSAHSSTEKAKKEIELKKRDCNELGERYNKEAMILNKLIEENDAKIETMKIENENLEKDQELIQSEHMMNVEELKKKISERENNILNPMSIDIKDLNKSIDNNESSTPKKRNATLKTKTPRSGTSKRMVKGSK